MKIYRRTLLISLFFTGLMGCEHTQFEEPNLKITTQLQQSALTSPRAYDLVESLTVEIGPRLADSKKDLFAVQWAENKLTQQGFDKVYKETVKVPMLSIRY